MPNLGLKRRYPVHPRRFAMDALFLEDLDAEINTLVADVDSGPGHEPADLPLRLAAKGTPASTPSLGHGNSLQKAQYGSSFSSMPKWWPTSWRIVSCTCSVNSCSSATMFSWLRW